MRRPPLTIKKILAWADSYHRRTGRWPRQSSGGIPESGGDTWAAVQGALNVGCRGLHGGDTLPKLLARHRGVTNVRALPRLTLRQILKWADAHQRRTGKWPHQRSGPIPGVPDMDWLRVERAVYTGARGWPGGTTLARLLEQHRGIVNLAALPALSVEQILRWGDAHHRRTGLWPNSNSGWVRGTHRETWARIDSALRIGLRGLEGGSSLALFFEKYRAARHRQYPPPLSVDWIIAWADSHWLRTGEWPNADSGPVADNPAETWRAVDEALRRGKRGVRRSSLARLLFERRHVVAGRHRPQLKEAEILRWARAHHQRTGRWPSELSGSIFEQPQDTWAAIDKCLRNGHRGLRGGASLPQLLRRRYRR